VLAPTVVSEQGDLAMKSLSLVALILAMTVPVAAQAHWATLFTAQDVRDDLTTIAGRDTALTWCRAHNVDHVYLENFRNGYSADPAVLAAARDFFRRAGVAVGGCVTTTELGKPSTGWKIAACYTNRANRAHLRSVFHTAATLFDRILIDDFFFTDCRCSECAAARGARSWEAYRRDLMLNVARHDILDVVHAVNPDARVILKFPQWYDTWQARGYRVDAESQLFDDVWIGNETRNPRDPHWGQTAQYRAFLITRWLHAIAGAKLRGGWFDAIDTPPDLYLDQAYETVLSQVPEILLFEYGMLQRQGAADAAALQHEMPALMHLSTAIQNTHWRGVATYKPPNSDSEGENYLLDEAGMVGIPLAPRATFPQHAATALFASQVLGDPDFVPQLVRFLAAGHRAILTAPLAHALEGDPRLPGFPPATAEDWTAFDLLGGHVVVVSDAVLRAAHPAADAGALLPTPLPAATARLRALCLRDLGIVTDAPLRVLLFPGDHTFAVHNVNDAPATFQMAWAGAATQTVTVAAHRAVVLPAPTAVSAGRGTASGPAIAN